MSTEDLQQLVVQMQQRLGELESQVAELKAQQVIPDDIVMAISAAVAAFLGHKAKVRAISLSGGRRWATENRGRVHDRSVARR